MHARAFDAERGVDAVKLPHRVFQNALTVRDGSRLYPDKKNLPYGVFQSPVPSAAKKLLDALSGAHEKLALVRLEFDVLAVIV